MNMGEDGIKKIEKNNLGNEKNIVKPIKNISIIIQKNIMENII